LKIQIPSLASGRRNDLRIRRISDWIDRAVATAGGASLTRWQLVEKVVLVAISAAAKEPQVTRT